MAAFSLSVRCSRRRAAAYPNPALHHDWFSSKYIDTTQGWECGPVADRSIVLVYVPTAVSIAAYVGKRDKSHAGRDMKLPGMNSGVSGAI
jgi:hypothetical protein